jgi:hypothetical protein
MLTFPLTRSQFIEAINARAFHPTIKNQQEIGYQASGNVIAKDLGPGIWQASIETVPMRIRQAMAVQQLINALHGSVNSFMCYSRFIQGPLSDPKGTILGASTPTVLAVPTSNSISFQGLPNGYVLTPGDRFSVPGSTSGISYHELQEGYTVGGPGTTTALQVEPEMSSGVAASAAVTFIKPIFLAAIVPNSLKVNVSGSVTNFTFDVIQVSVSQ